MNSTVQELADRVGGKLEGDGSVRISAARPLAEAGSGDITFVDSDRHFSELEASPAAAGVVKTSAPTCGKPLIRVADPRAAFTTIVQILHGRPQSPASGVDPRAIVHSSAVIGPDVSIEPLAVVGSGSVIGTRCRIGAGVVIGRDCVLGDDVTLHPHVVLYDGAILGHRVIVHANVVLGADGFGYRFENGRHIKEPQLGRIEIGDDVEIGACTTIDRGTFGATRIGDGTKIDNLVMIAHNCQIGRHNILVGQMGMAGSSSTGDYVTIAGQAGIVNHVHIGEGATIGAQSGVTKDVPSGVRMWGSPATLGHQQKRMVMAAMKHADLRRKIRRIFEHLGLRDSACAGTTKGTHAA